MNENEIWRVIPDYPFYQVSNLGRVRSIDRNISYELYGVVRQKFLRGKMLTLRKDRTGTLRVYINKKYMIVSRLVMKTFFKCKKSQVVHINGNKEDNRLCNLKYMTKKETTEHNYKIGLDYRNRIAEYSHKNKIYTKISYEQVLEIRDMYKTGEYTEKELAKKYNVHKDTIRYLIKGNKRKNIN